MGVPRYLIAARADDVDHTLLLADELLGRNAHYGPVALVQCGRQSPIAVDLGERLRRAGRSSVAVVVDDRAQAQSDATLQKLTGAGSVWVFADDLFQTFMNVFATRLAFALRANAREGLPVVGIGDGALALGGLLLASRVCPNSRYELVGGLGWAPRVLVDGGAKRGAFDAAITRSAVHSLPGLLGVELGVGGGLRVQGTQLESVGSEPISLFSTGDNGRLMTIQLEPGQVMRMALPPFPPFSGVEAPVKPVAVEAEVPARLRQVVPQAETPPHNPPAAGRVCPMCHKVHAEPRMQLAA